MLLVIFYGLLFVVYCLVGIFLSGLYIGLDFHETRGSLELALAILSLVIWPIALLLGLVALGLLASYRLANRIWSLGRVVGFDLAENLEI